jgi:hypothetical protein
MRKFLAWAAALALSVPAMAAPPFPMGAYTSNPNGNDAKAMQTFKDDWDGHSKAIGHRPTFFNIFIDFGQDPSTWPKSASWGAWSAKMSGPNYLANATPVIGVPLASNAGGWGKVNDFYKATSAGTFDAAWAGIVDGYVDQGYKTLDFRPGYEFDGGFMPWSPLGSKDADAAANFVKAFQHVADILHKRAAEKGAKAYVHWNPAAINDTPYDIVKLYPGDAYVDVISVDIYSPLYPLGYVDWSTGGKTTLSKDAFVANPVNRAHVWRYTNASQRIPKPTLGNWGWSVSQTIEFAKLHKKMLGVDETGSGPSGSSIGLADDPEFPKFLAGILNEAKASGLTIRNVNVWDAKLGDGDWNFYKGTKPLAAASWKQHFADTGAAPAAPAPVVPAPAPAPAPAPKPPVVTKPPVVVPAKLGTLTIGQGIVKPSKTVVLAGSSNLTGWSKANSAKPIKAKIGSHIYLVVKAAANRLTLKTAGRVADVKWGAKVVPQ